MAGETIVEKYLVKRVRETGGRTRKLCWIGRRGAPDRAVWWRCAESILGPIYPDLVFVELKAPGKKATVQQKREHANMRADGFEVYVIDSKEQVDAMIKERGW